MTATPGQAAYEAYVMAAPDDMMFAVPGSLHDWERDAWEAAAQAGYEQRFQNDAAAQEPHAAPELAAATRETRRMRDIVCNLLDLFGQPDARLMQHASVTRATLQRYAGQAGVRLDGHTS